MSNENISMLKICKNIKGLLKKNPNTKISISKNGRSKIDQG